MLLEDIGLKVRYPLIHHVDLDDDGGCNITVSFSCVEGNRVSIEQNPLLKLMNLFSLLDFFIDQKHPHLAGRSFYSKYKGLPRDDDYDIALKEIFRIAKVMRNALVHNSSAISFNSNGLNIEYKFRDTDFKIDLSHEALEYFYTAIVMYVKADLGQGEYFLGIMRGLYKDIILGINTFCDEFGTKLHELSNGLVLLRYSRDVVRVNTYNHKRDKLYFPNYQSDFPKWRGADLLVNHNENMLLIPIEALDDEFSIEEVVAIRCWKAENPFPPLKTF